MNGYRLHLLAEQARETFMNAMGHTVCADWSKLTDQQRRAWESVVIMLQSPVVVDKPDKVC